jgi:pyruvate dehydrogenase E2 component (dihydrolipoamide acetyltransferase)
VDLNRISGTGPHGRILLADVQEAKEEAGVAPAAAGAEYTDVPVNTIRRITATRLQESKQSVPHFYSSIDCVMDRLLAVRAEMNAHFTSAKLSVNDFVMKAAARALHEVPEVNSKWVDNTTIRRLHRANLGVAVQTDSGLMVPVVENVGTKSIYSVNADVSSSAKKAKDMKLQPSEMEGGTFTVSNLGMFGVKDFCAIVNPPQAGILAVGATRQEVVPSSQSASGVATQNVMTVTLSADHRVVDGAVGAQWLSAFKGAVEAPASLVAEGG